MQIRGFVYSFRDDWDWMVDNREALPYAEREYTLGPTEALYLVGLDAVVMPWLADTKRRYQSNIYGLAPSNYNIRTSDGSHLAYRSIEGLRPRKKVSGSAYGLEVGKQSFLVVEVCNAACGRQDVQGLTVSQIKYEALGGLMLVDIGTKCWLSVRNPLANVSIPNPFRKKYQKLSECIRF
jgi:hypothetical protein